MKILTTPRMERCIGCHSCSLACARLVHKNLSWDTAGIRIASSGGLSTGFEARTCLACDPAPCVLACPTGAYSQRKGGGVIVRKNLCIRCGECDRACPVDAIYLDTTRRPIRLHPLRPLRPLLPTRLSGDEGCSERWTNGRRRCGMIRDKFRVLSVDLGSGRGNILEMDGRDTVAGGSGLAALLFSKYGHPDKTVG